VALIWKSGIEDRKISHFTTAAAVVGPNSVVYAASNDDRGGIIHAYHLANGTLLWRKDFALEANQGVAVGPLAGTGGRLAVVAGLGQNPGLPLLSYLLFVSPSLTFFCLVFQGLFYCCCGKWWLSSMASLFLLVLSILFFHATEKPEHEHTMLLPVIMNSAKFSFLMLLYLQMLLRCLWWNEKPRRCCRRALAAFVFCSGYIVAAVAVQKLSLLSHVSPLWLWHSRDLAGSLVALDAQTGQTLWTFSPPLYRGLSCAGDEELFWPRLMKRREDPLGDEYCLPDSWSQAVIDANGTVFVGNMDGRLYIVRDEDGDGEIAGREASSLDFGNAFQATQAIAPGMFVVVPCGGGMHVWRA